MGANARRARLVEVGSDGGGIGRSRRAAVRSGRPPGDPVVPSPDGPLHCARARVMAPPVRRWVSLRGAQHHAANFVSAHSLRASAKGGLAHARAQRNAMAGCAGCACNGVVPRQARLNGGPELPRDGARRCRGCSPRLEREVAGSRVASTPARPARSRRAGIDEPSPCLTRRRRSINASTPAAWPAARGSSSSRNSAARSAGAAGELADDEWMYGDLAILHASGQHGIATAGWSAQTGVDQDHHGFAARGLAAASRGGDAGIVPPARRGARPRCLDQQPQAFVQQRGALADAGQLVGAGEQLVVEVEWVAHHAASVPKGCLESTSSMPF